jgi:hypothetical protein
MDKMPEWLRELLITGGGLTLLGGGIRVWWTGWVADRDRKRQIEEKKIAVAEAAVAATIKSLEDRNSKLEARLESYGEKLVSVLVDQAANAEEAKEERAKRRESDDKLHAAIEVNAEIIKRATTILARIEKGETP